MLSFFIIKLLITRALMRFYLSVLILTCSLLRAEKIPQKLIPWYTGSLLALSGKVIPAGQFAFQPYIFINDTYGSYKNNFSLKKTPSIIGINPFLLFQGGITHSTDFQFTMQSFTNFSNGQSVSYLGDSSAQLGFQALWAKPNTSIPDIRLTINQSFPTGKFQNLNEGLKGADSTGSGSYATTFGANIQKLFYPSPIHPLRLRYNFFYTISSKVTAYGLQTYGGEKGGETKIAPGNEIEMILAPEYSLTQNWVITTDITYTHGFKTKIQTQKPVKATVYQPSFDEFTLAPAIEYSFSKNFGIIWGVWFTVFGRNTNAFANATLSFVYGF